VVALGDRARSGPRWAERAMAPMGIGGAGDSVSGVPWWRSSRGGRLAWGASSSEPRLADGEVSGDRRPSSSSVRPVSFLSSLWWWLVLALASSPVVSGRATSEVTDHGWGENPARRLPMLTTRRGHGLGRVLLSLMPGETLGPARRSGRRRRHGVALFLKMLSWLLEVCLVRRGWGLMRCPVLAATQSEGFRGAMYVMLDVPKLSPSPRPAGFCLLLADSL
jgi:hypothetical protein